MKFGTISLDEAEGAILAHGILAAGVNFRKGRTLAAADLRALAAAGVATVVAARFEPGDVPEDVAATRLAEAVAGGNVRIARAFTGRANIHAEKAGLLVLDRERIDRLNERHEAVTVATLQPFAQVAAGEMVATAKIIPLAVPEDLLGECLAIATEAPLVRVAAWRPLSAWLIQTTLPRNSAKMLDKTVRVTRQRLEDLGGSLLGESRAAHEPLALAEALAAVGPEADLILIAGASAITDRRDALPAGVIAAGGVLEHFGMPVDPGNLILLARLGERTVLGLPGCSRSPKLNGFDWVLQRLVAGLDVAPRDIMRMGVGGLLTEIPTRPHPRGGGRHRPSTGDGGAGAGGDAGPLRPQSELCRRPQHLAQSRDRCPAARRRCGRRLPRRHATGHRPADPGADPGLQPHRGPRHRGADAWRQARQPGALGPEPFL
jgi:molybdenum cofactor cytidylyltransferase